MIETGAETFALPLETVEEIQVLEPTDIKLIRSREVMILRGRSSTFGPLEATSWLPGKY